MAGEDEGRRGSVVDTMWTGMDFVRIRNGKLVELWSNQATLGMLRQLDVLRFEITQKSGED